MQNEKSQVPASVAKDLDSVAKISEMMEKEVVKIKTVEDLEREKQLILRQQEIIFGR